MVRAHAGVEEGSRAKEGVGYMHTDYHFDSVFDDKCMERR
jgi:hypothetical protein